MPKAQPVYRWLYLSRLAPGQSHDAVAAILRVSRKHNANLGIGGALVFDGERFAQLLEGPRPVVMDMASRIALDARHTDLCVLYEGESTSPMACIEWRAGYAEGTTLDGLMPSSAGAPSQGPLQRFMAMLASCDLV